MTKYKFNRMEDFLYKFPEDLLFYKQLKEIKLPTYKEINFIGMGGSGIAGRLLSPFLKIKHNFVNTYYDKQIFDAESLNILISYSGNTEETLSFFDKLKNKNTIGISSGGKLEKLFTREKLPFFKLPKGYPPRCALGLMFSLLSFILKEKINFKIEELDRLKSFLEKKRKEFSDLNGPVMDLAYKFYRRLVNIYTAYPYNFCALRIKTQLNENSNHFVHIDFLPEMNHNEIEGLQNPPEIVEKSWVVFIKGKFMHEKNKLRIEKTKEIIEDRVMGITIFEPEGENLLEEIFYIVYFFDYLSLYLAKINKVDPFEIKRIETLKKFLS